jgi:hypothetical protein
MTTQEQSRATGELLANLVRELFQTETSAARHCRREADRLGETEPAKAMRAIAEQAKAVLAELPALCEREGLPVSVVGSLTGRLFSELRDKLADGLIQSERSYRATLLGTRHGLDVVHMVELTADCANRIAVVSFCQGWLTTRTVLVERAAEAMRWFAQHPEESSRLARPLIPRLRARELHA